MKVRPLLESDIPTLQEWANASGFEYPEPTAKDIEAIMVVAGGDDVPILAAAAKRLVEVFGWFDPTAGAELRGEAIRLIHQPMIDALKQKGYECAEVFIPPQLERRGLGRILRDRFHWRRNWPSYGKRFGL